MHVELASTWEHRQRLDATGTRGEHGPSMTGICAQVIGRGVRLMACRSQE